TGHGRALDAPILIELEVGVDAADAVVAARELTIRENCADGGLIENVAADPRDGKGGTLAAVGIGRRQYLAWRTVVAGHHADCPRAGFSSEPESVFRVGDAAREDQVDRCCEEVAVLEEEGPLLGEEDFEALVYRDLGLVGFDLTEIWIHRCVEHEAPGQDEFSVKANIRFESAAFEDRMVGVALVDVAEAAKEAIGNQLNVAAGRD